jgi:hypothetical protein
MSSALNISTQICARQRSITGRALTNESCLEHAFLCMLEDAPRFIGMRYDGQHVRTLCEDKAVVNQLQMTEEEFLALFATRGITPAASATLAINEHLLAQCDACIRELADALQATLAEPMAKRAWGDIRTRLGCTLSIAMPSRLDMLTRLIGTIMRVDQRRVHMLRSAWRDGAKRAQLVCCCEALAHILARSA